MIFKFFQPNWIRNKTIYKDKQQIRNGRLSSDTVCKVIVVGDFNFPDIDWSTLLGSVISPSNRIRRFIEKSEVVYVTAFHHVINGRSISGKFLELPPEK